ncbi:gamma-glutamyltransferase family protein [Pseudomonas sp. NPDC089401]|uniref:gamma-glutamyltransferase family protein n=1 Tax=Pseudomonas sp. NPDC089401 TaxID=3364462 RepID=UPI0038082F2C
MNESLVAHSRGGVLCTPHPLASAAGLDVLDGGGTAIDAMLAASAVLAAVYPHMTGLGGDALWLLHDDRIRTIIGIGQAGSRLPDGGAISLRGPGSLATTAGAMASWEQAKALSEGWGSRMGWADLLNGAAGLAREGVEVSASQRFWQGQRAALIDSMPGLQMLCRQPGNRLRQPALANTLEQLARRGPEDFYHGELAEALGQAFDTLGCGLTRDDLRATHAYLAAPISVRYRNGWLYNVAPPTQGLYTLRAMAALDAMDLGENGAPRYYHLLVEAIKQGLLQRNRQLHDPHASGWDFADSLARPAAPLDPQQAAPWAEPGQPADTVWMAATDREGRSACLIQSLFHDFGSGCLLGDTGILWHNRAAGFNPQPGHVNAWAPGKRPAHTLNPSAYLADDGRRWFFGTQGGDGQPQTQMVLATQLIDYQQPPQAALRTPRFLLGRSFFDSTDNLKLEADIGAPVLRGLAERGHAIETTPALSPLMGLAGVIAIDAHGRRTAAYDPRSQGSALGQAD